MKTIYKNKLTNLVATMAQSLGFNNAKRGKLQSTNVQDAIDEISNILDEEKTMISDAWNSSTTYTVGQYCIYNNCLWKCKVQHTGQTPSEGTYWTKTQIDDEILSIKNDVSTINSNLSDIGKISILMQSGYSTGDNVDVLDLSQYRMITFIAIWDGAQFVNMYTIPYSVFNSFIGGVMILKVSNDESIQIRPIDNTHINLRCSSTYLALRIYGIK